MKKIIGMIAILLIFSVSIFATNSTLKELKRQKEIIEMEYETFQDELPMLKETQEEANNQLIKLNDQCCQLSFQLLGNNNKQIFGTSMLLSDIQKLQKELEKAYKSEAELSRPIQEDYQRYLLLEKKLSQDSYHAISDVQTSESADTISTALSSLTHEISEEEQAMRDSCLFYIRKYLVLLSEFDSLSTDRAEKYQLINASFQETISLTESRYESMKMAILEGGQTSIVDLFSSLPLLIETAIKEFYIYIVSESNITISELLIVIGEMSLMLLIAILAVWLILRITRNKTNLFKRLKQNPKIYANTLYVILLGVCLITDLGISNLPYIQANGSAFFVLILFTAFIQISLLLRETGETASAAIRMYVPSIAYSMLIVFMRFFVLPDALIELLIFPISLGCFIWQSVVIFRYWNKASNADTTLSAISSIIFLAMTISSALGYVFMAMMILFWWQAQLICIIIIMALNQILKKNRSRTENRKKIYLKKTLGKEVESTPEHMIHITWLDDFLRITTIPLLVTLSIPLCASLAFNFFNGNSLFEEYFYKTLFSIGPADNVVFNLSFYNITLSACLFYIFKYLQHFLISLFIQVRTYQERKKTGLQEVNIKDINVALGTKIMSIIVWSVYIIAVCIIFKLPLQSITVVLAGMAAGLSFAMQEIVTNFFYGIQLLSGQLRVGDYVICGNHRGSVTNINYQTTRIFTETGADVCFTNKELFNKNFQNLTKQNPYEVNRIYFLIPYEKDVQQVEKIATEEIMKLNRQDKFGRQLLSVKEIQIEMSNLDSSGIEMAVRFAVLAEQMTWFLPVLRKAIYMRLKNEGINIPFNQVDLHIVQK